MCTCIISVPLAARNRTAMMIVLLTAITQTNRQSSTYATQRKMCLRQNKQVREHNEVFVTKTLSIPPLRSCVINNTNSLRLKNHLQINNLMIVVCNVRINGSQLLFQSISNNQSTLCLEKSIPHTRFT